MIPVALGSGRNGEDNSSQPIKIYCDVATTLEMVTRNNQTEFDHVVNNASAPTVGTIAR